MTHLTIQTDGDWHAIGVLRVVDTIQDITERKRENQNLRRMATVLRDSNDAITIQDFGGRIAAWNRGAEQMYGYSEKEALLMDIARLTPPGKVEEQAEFIRRLIAGEAITSFETQHASGRNRGRRVQGSGCDELAGQTLHRSATGGGVAVGSTK